MTYKFNHVHLKAPDPEITADWYVNAFDAVLSFILNGGLLGTIDRTFEVEIPLLTA